MLLYMNYMQVWFCRSSPPWNKLVSQKCRLVSFWNKLVSREDKLVWSPKQSSDFRKQACFRGGYGT